MEINRIKKAIAIFLLVCFLVSVTATAVSAFDSKKTTGKTTTIAEKFKDKSNLVSQIPKEKAYKYLNIWVGTGGVATSTEKNPTHTY